MEYYLRLCGEEKLLFFINKINVGILENNEDYLLIKITDESEFLLTIFPIQNSPKTSISYMSKCSLKNNILSSDNPNIIITNYPNNYYKIYAKKIYVNCTNTFGNPIEFQDKENKLILNEFYPQSINFTDSSLHNTSINLNFFVKNAKINEFLQYYAVRGTVDTTNDYLMLINKQGKKLLEVSANKIEITDTEITTLELIKDVNGHGYVTNYLIKNNQIKLEKSYSVFINNYPKKPANIYAINWAFVEAINIGNLSLAREYLTNELNSILDDNHLINFFGNYTEMETNWISDNQMEILVISADFPRVAKIYTFELKDNKISNIENFD